MNGAPRHPPSTADRPFDSGAPSPARPAGPLTQAQSARLERLAADISERLRRVCSHLSEEEFSVLVHDIARTTMRFEEREFESPLETAEPPRRSD
jgi:hypothetical protein